MKAKFCEIKQYFKHKNNLILHTFLPGQFEKNIILEQVTLDLLTHALIIRN